MIKDVTICVEKSWHNDKAEFFLNNIPFEVMPKRFEVIEIEDLPEWGTLKLIVKRISHSFTKSKTSDEYSQLVTIHACNLEKEDITPKKIWKKIWE